MANFCENKLVVSGKTKDIIGFKNDFVRKGFEVIMPIPADIKVNHVHSINWRCDNWGVKANAEILDVNDNTVYFDTPWAPPSIALLKLASVKYRINIQLYFSESGLSFEGKYTIHAGQEIEQVIVNDMTNPINAQKMVELEGFDNLIERLEQDADLNDIDKAVNVRSLAEQGKWTELFSIIYIG